MSHPSMPGPPARQTTKVASASASPLQGHPLVAAACARPRTRTSVAVPGETPRCLGLGSGLCEPDTFESAHPQRTKLLRTRCRHTRPGQCLTTTTSMASTSTLRVSCRRESDGHHGGAVIAKSGTGEVLSLKLKLSLKLLNSSTTSTPTDNGPKWRPQPDSPWTTRCYRGPVLTSDTEA